MSIVALILLLSTSDATPPPAPLPDARPVSAERLDQMRGGFDLPGGGSVTLGVVTTTRVDGQEVLRTVFNIQAGTPVVTVQARTVDGLVPVSVARDGAGIETAAGTVRLTTTPNGTRVELSGDRLDVSHLVGGAFGSVVANGADNRAVDVATTVDVSMSGVARDAVGSSRAGIDTLALDATSRLVR